MSYSATILAEPGLQAYYRLNETSGTIAHDSSPNAYHATVSGATMAQPSAVATDTDFSMLFTADGGISLPFGINPSTWSAASLEFWIKLESDWHYVLVTTDAESTLLYLDHLQVASGDGSGSEVFVSLLSMAGSLMVGGGLDEVAVYNVKLSPARWLAHYNASVPTPIGHNASVFVGNQPVFVVATTLQVQETIGRRGQGAFYVRGSTAIHFEQDQQVTMYDGSGTLLFSGFISQPKEQKPGFQPSLITQVQVVDNHRIADKLIIARAYTNRTRTSIVRDIAQTILAQEGVTIGAIYDEAGNVQTLYPSPTLYPSSTLYPQGNPTIGVVNATFAYCTVATALDKITQDMSVAGIPYYWAIDKNKRFWCVPYTYVRNEHTIDGTTIDQVTTPATVTRSNPAYRNAQYVVGGMAQTDAQHATRIGDGNTTAFPMDYPLAATPTITLNSNPQTVGIQQVDTGKDWYWNLGDPNITQDSSGTKLVSTDTLSIDYVGQFPIVTYQQSDAQVAYEASLDGTSGLVEEVEQDPTISTLSDSISRTSGLLTRYATQGMLFEGTQLGNDQGYAAGQLVPVDLPDHGIHSRDMLIEKITISDQTDGVNLWATIDAIVGPFDTDWVSFFGTVVRQQAPATSINAGVSQSLVLLQQFTASMTVTAELTTTVTACPLPSLTQYPRSDLYPC